MSEEDNKQKIVNLDKILVEEIGQIGPYQLRILGLSVIVVIFAAWAASEYVFTTARIETRYLIIFYASYFKAGFSEELTRN